jgi:large subunit ribosomal protein L18
MSLKSRKERRKKRHARVRRKVHGSADRPRMSIMVSGRAMYVQFIDDDNAVTLASAVSGTGESNNAASARALGQRAAEAALAKGIKRAVIDRGGFSYHGRVEVIVTAATELGLQTGVQVAAPAEDKEEK